MNVQLSKDDVFFQALKQAILELFPEYTSKITTKRECARLYLHLVEAQRLTKNDHIMKLVAARFNEMQSEFQLTNMSAAEYFCKKFKQHATAEEANPLLSDKNIQLLLDFLSDCFE